MRLIDTTAVTAALLSGRAAQPGLVRHLRQHAAEALHDACMAIGINAADLEDNDRAVVATLLLRKATSPPMVRQTAVLLRWCIQFEEHGPDDVAVGRILQALQGMEAAQRGEHQRARATQERKVTEAHRKAIRKAYKDRVAAGDKYGAIKDLTNQFPYSRDTISDIVNDKTK